MTADRNRVVGVPAGKAHRTSYVAPSFFVAIAVVWVLGVLTVVRVGVPLSAAQGNTAQTSTASQDVRVRALSILQSGADSALSELLDLLSHEVVKDEFEKTETLEARRRQRDERIAVLIRQPFMVMGKASAIQYDADKEQFAITLDTVPRAAQLVLRVAPEQYQKISFVMRRAIAESPECFVSVPFAEAKSRKPNIRVLYRFRVQRPPDSSGVIAIDNVEVLTADDGRKVRKFYP